MPGETGAYVTVEQLAAKMNIDVDHARRFIRRHRDILHPFRLGREIRMLPEKVDIALTLLQQGKIH